jgi:hypothetical protein
MWVFLRQGVWEVLLLKVCGFQPGSLLRKLWEGGGGVTGGSGRPRRPEEAGAQGVQDPACTGGTPYSSALFSPYLAHFFRAPGLKGFSGVSVKIIGFL